MAATEERLLVVEFGESKKYARGISIYGIISAIIGWDVSFRKAVFVISACLEFLLNTSFRTRGASFQVVGLNTKFRNHSKMSSVTIEQPQLDPESFKIAS